MADMHPLSIAGRSDRSPYYQFDTQKHDDILIIMAFDSLRVKDVATWAS